MSNLVIGIIIVNIFISYKGIQDRLFLDRYKFQVGPILAGHKSEPYYSAVGASGAVSGVVYSAIILNPEMSLILFPIPIPLPGYVFGVGYLLYSMYAMKKQIGNIGHSAHLGGAIGGFLITVIIYPEILVQNTLIVGLLAIPIVLLFLIERGKK